MLKRANRHHTALEAYERSLEVSGGHPYPLLNALKLRAQVNGRLALTPADRRVLARAEHVREGQAKQSPPLDKPWCFFDLAEIKLYRGDILGFLASAEQGLRESEEDWQFNAFVTSLRFLAPTAEELPGLEEALVKVEKLV